MRLTPLSAALAASLLLAEVGFADEIAGRPAVQASACRLHPANRIPLPGVYGRMDHYGWTASAAGFCRRARKRYRRDHRRLAATALDHRFGASAGGGLCPPRHCIAVSDQVRQGPVLRNVAAAPQRAVRTVDFGEYANADNMRYDARSKLLYVGYAGLARRHRHDLSRYDGASKRVQARKPSRVIPARTRAAHGCS